MASDSRSRHRLSGGLPYWGWGYNINNAPGTTNGDPTYNFLTYAGLPTTPASRMPGPALDRMLPTYQPTRQDAQHTPHGEQGARVRPRPHKPKGPQTDYRTKYNSQTRK